MEAIVLYMYIFKTLFIVVFNLKLEMESQSKDLQFKATR